MRFKRIETWYVVDMELIWCFAPFPIAWNLPDTVRRDFQGFLWILYMLCVLFLIGCCFSHPVSYSIRVSNVSLLLAAICPLSLSLSLLVTQASRVKSVTLRCVSPPLCDHDAPPTMLFSQHATRPLIPHANIRFLRPPASRPPHPSIILLLPLLHI